MSLMRELPRSVIGEILRSVVHEVQGASKPADRAYGTDHFMLTPWDRSIGPRTNDRVAKLGIGAGTNLISVASFDTVANRISLANNQRARFEPDNYVYLDHGGLDKVWAHRDIVDHENTSASIKHRSDIVVNQKKKMCWAYKQDLQWVVEVKEIGAPIPKGREFDGAGFIGTARGGPSLKAANIGLGSAQGAVMAGVPSVISSKAFGGRIGMPPVKLTGITKQPKGGKNQPVETPSNSKAIRAVLALNNNQRGGFFTDGKGVGQTAQLWHFMPIKPPKPKRPDTPTGHSPPRHSDTPTGSGDAGLDSYEQRVEEARRKQQERLRNGGGGSRLPLDPSGFGGYLETTEEFGGYLDGDRERRDQGGDVDTTTLEQSGGPDGDCMVERQMAALRGDVIFDMGGKPSHLAMEEVAAAMSDEAYYGGFILRRPSPLGPKYFPAEDKTSDQPILDRPPRMEGQYGIRPWVKIPKNTGTPPQCEVQPHFDPASPAYGTTGVIPPYHTGAGADAGVYRPPSVLVHRAMAIYEFKPGYVTSIGDSIILPSTRTDMRFMVEVPYQLPANLAGAEAMDFRFYYKVVSGLEQTVGDTWTEFTRSITASDNPATADQVKCLRFEIPPIRFSKLGGGGGRIHYRFMRRSDDTAGAAGRKFWLVGNIQSSYSPALSQRTRQYGSAA